MMLRYFNYSLPLLVLFSACGNIYKHDLVIRNGMIVDGTGKPRFQGDISINGDMITNVGSVNGI